MGQYSELINHLGNYLGWEFISPGAPTQASIESGTKGMSELMCLPAKVGLGDLIQACKKGAEKLLMFDSCGECRLKTYWILQQRALRKLGYNVTVYPMRLGKMTPTDLRRVDPSIPYWKAWMVFIRIIRDIYRFDKNQCYDIPEDNSLVKVGVVGEIYTMLEPAVNKRLFEKLGKQGVLVHNSLPLSYFIFKGLYNRGWLRRKGLDRDVLLEARKRAYKYFPKEIGGHGNESIIHTIYYALMGFDGVIHVLPFPCSPEATVASVIDDIQMDYNIPVMRLIFDTHTGETSLDTRIEAFCDILKRKKVGKK